MSVDNDNGNEFPDFDLASLLNRITDATDGSEPEDSPADLAQIFSGHHDTPLLIPEKYQTADIGYKVLHLNIQGLQSKFDEFKIFAC